VHQGRACLARALQSAGIQRSGLHPTISGLRCAGMERVLNHHISSEEPPMKFKDSSLITVLLLSSLAALCAGCDAHEDLTGGGQLEAVLVPQAKEGAGKKRVYRYVFTAGPAMKSRRVAHTSTLLEDGKVLMTGGYDGNTAVDTAEIYDPATNSFTLLAAKMPVKMAYQTATLLPDGKVLLVGGHDGVNTQSSRMIYDPATQTFSSVNNCESAQGAVAACSPRYNHTATLLDDGRVLIVGGWVTGYSLGSTAEVYDPATGKFTTLAAALPNVRYDSTTERFVADALATEPARLGYHSAVKLPNGRVLLAAGVLESSPQHDMGSSSLVFSFDPEDDTFVVAADLEIDRFNYNYVANAALTLNNELFIIGGVSFAPGAIVGETLAMPVVYNPQNGSKELPGCDGCVPRNGNNVVVLKDEHERILSIGGGDDNTGEVFSTAELFTSPNPPDKRVKGGYPMVEARYSPCATVLQDGRVLVTGGAASVDYSPSILQSSEIFE
jgi:hypothetical protein